MARRKQRKDVNGKVIKLPEAKRCRATEKGIRGWKAPLDMPDTMVKKVLSGKCCGGKLVNGQYCNKTNVVFNPAKPPPYRCPAHGGSKGSHAKAGNKISLKYGLYTDCMLPDEQDIYDKLDISDMDEEIKMVKLRLRRALKADAEKNPTHMITVEEVLKRAPNGEYVVVDYTRSMDAGYSIEINKLIRQLCSLQNTRTQIKEADNFNTMGGRSSVVIYLPDNGRMNK